MSRAACPVNMHPEGFWKHAAWKQQPGNTQLFTWLLLRLAGWHARRPAALMIYHAQRGLVGNFRLVSELLQRTSVRSLRLVLVDEWRAALALRNAGIEVLDLLR